MSRIFPEVSKKTSNGIYASNDERFLYQYPLVRKYLLKKIEGWSIYNFFERFGEDNSICIYAATDFAELLVKDFNNDKKRVKYVCDKSFKEYKYGFFDCLVISKNELIQKYNKNEITKILIASVFYENIIFKELIDEGVSTKDIITVMDVL